MRARRCALAALAALLAVACGGGGGSAPCGAAGEACCTSGAACEGALACDAAAGTCRVECGRVGEACCAAASTCEGALLCDAGTCRSCPLDEAGVSWLAFTTVLGDDYDVAVAHLDGTCLIPAATGATDELFPAFTPAGGLGYSSTRSGGSSLYVHDLGTGADAGIPTPGYAAAAPSFAAGGVWVAFEGRGSGATHADVYRVLAVGGIPEALTAGTGTNAGPVYAPGGETLYFVSNRAGAYQVYSMAADGSGQAVVPGTSGVLGRPAISPDGATLAFARLDGGGVAEVVRMDLATHTPVVVSDQGDTDPAFDATGTRLAVSSTRGGDAAIWILDAADGANAARVTTPAAGEVHGQPAFRP